MRKTGAKVMNHATGVEIDEIVQYLAPRYNSDSDLTAEVTASGPNQFEFALTSE